MASCKDCIHENVCINNKAYDDYHFDSCEEKVNKLGCKGFKDKSRYIELPCKVGDTVYKVMDIESVHRQILEMKVLSIEIKDATKFFAKTVKKYRYNYGTFTLDDFGKTVFLTHKEAERKEVKGR